MTAYLPPNLASLFKPRPPIPYIEPIDKDPNITSKVHIDGVGQFLNDCKNFDTAYKVTPTAAEKKLQKVQRRKQQTEERLEHFRSTWDPFSTPDATGDAYKTLIVARLNYSTTENTIFEFFKRFGPIVRVKLICDKNSSKSRGYAFVEFEDERDLRDAYKGSAGARIDDRDIVVDVERGRTVKNWLPRRLGGGLGDTRIGGHQQADRDRRRKQKQSGARDRHMSDSRPRSGYSDNYKEQDKWNRRSQGSYRSRPSEFSSRRSSFDSHHSHHGPYPSQSRRQSYKNYGSGHQNTYRDY